MKKLISLILVFVLLFLFNLPLYAVESVTQSLSIVRDPQDRLRVNQTYYSVTMTVTTAANGSVTATVVSGTAASGSNAMVLWGWYLYSVKTVAGSTTPTNGWSITVKDASGFDLLGGKGLSSQSNSATVPVKTFAFPSGGAFSPVSGPLTVAITGNSVDSANITVTLDFVR